MNEEEKGLDLEKSSAHIQMGISNLRNLLCSLGTQIPLPIEHHAVKALIHTVKTSDVGVSWRGPFLSHHLPCVMNDRCQRLRRDTFHNNSKVMSHAIF